MLKVGVEQDAIIFPKDRFGPVSVVDIEVENSHAREFVLIECVPCGDRDVV